MTIVQLSLQRRIETNPQTFQKVLVLISVIEEGVGKLQYGTVITDLHANYEGKLVKTFFRLITVTEGFGFAVITAYGFMDTLIAQNRPQTADLFHGNTFNSSHIVLGHSGLVSPHRYGLLQNQYRLSLLQIRFFIPLCHRKKMPAVLPYGNGNLPCLNQNLLL